MPVGWLNKIHTSSKARDDFHNTRIAIHGYSQATAFKKPKVTKAGRKGCDFCHLPRKNMSKKLIETISWDKDIFVIRRIVTHTLTYHLITSVVHVIDIFREENTFNLLLFNVVKWSDTL